MEAGPKLDETAWMTSMHLASLYPARLRCHTIHCLGFWRCKGGTEQHNSHRLYVCDNDADYASRSPQLVGTRRWWVHTSSV